MNRFVVRRLLTLLCVSGLISISSEVNASGFQLWEQSGASVGNYHAGYAAEADDASIAFFNPAGITRIHNQQLVVGGVAINSDFQYHGSVGVTTTIGGFALPTQTYQSITAQGGQFAFVPNLHYVASISERVGFGLSVDAPFGLQTNYGRTTPAQYSATLSSIKTIDVSPSLGFQLSKAFSVGAGFDVQRMLAEFDNVATVATSFIPPSTFNTQANNKLNDTGYGGHLGVLYEFTPAMRAGLSYHSQVVHHLTGSSKFIGPLADTLNGGPLETSRTLVNMTLPPYTALSAYGDVTPKLSLMGSIIYTQWNTFHEVVLQDAAGVAASDAATTNLQVTIPENYRNTWNLSFGADYLITDRFKLKGGMGYDETPARNHLRNLQLPDNNRFVIALGAHYDASKRVGLDLGWTHFFIQTADINPPALVTGAQSVTTDGHVTGGADVFAGQITWNIV